MIKRDSVTRFFASGLFHESSSHKPLKITLGSVILYLFKNLRRYSQVKMHHWYQQHRWPICYRDDTGGKFATGTADVADTGGK